MIVFTNGCFDVLHSGHVHFLQQCRGLGSKLIVGLNSDRSVQSLKGSSRPINCLADRKYVLESIRYVDEVFEFDDLTPCRLIESIHPDIVAKGPGYSLNNMPEAKIVIGYGGKVAIVGGPDISTTKIIERIVKCQSLK